MTAPESTRWPAIPVAGRQDTRETLQLYTQVAGKLLLANEAAATTAGWDRDALERPDGGTHHG